MILVPQAAPAVVRKRARTRQLLQAGLLCNAACGSLGGACGFLPAPLRDRTEQPSRMQITRSWIITTWPSRTKKRTRLFTGPPLGYSWLR